MAAIITVHGTFASGPEDGAKWWQRGSELSRELEACVEAENGRLEIVPHVWDGRNSESSRRTAGLSLLDRMLALEAAGERYVLVGHSHGGSVIAAALQAAAARDQTLPSLSRWITVGTPFIRSRRRGLLFSRLGNIGRSAYLTCFAFGLLLTVLVAMQGLDPVSIQNGDTITRTHQFSALQIAELMLIAFLPLILLHAALWLREWRFSPFRSMNSARLAHFERLWLSLRHPGDEAIAGLRSVQRVRLPIFARDFLTGALTTLAAIVGPVVCVALVWTYMVPRSSLEASGYPLYVFIAKIVSLAPWHPKLPLLVPPANTVLTVISVLIMFTALLFVGALLFLYLAQWISGGISALLSRQLDRLTWNEMRRASLGSDTRDAMGYDVDVGPVWARSEQPALSPEIVAEMDRIAAVAAAADIPKLRAALQRLAFAGSEQGKAELLADYLSWEELIHTAYFKAPGFRKLLAEAICHSPGFKAKASSSPTAEAPAVGPIRIAADGA